MTAKKKKASAPRKSSKPLTGSPYLNAGKLTIPEIAELRKGWRLFYKSENPSDPKFAGHIAARKTGGDPYRWVYPDEVTFDGTNPTLITYATDVPYEVKSSNPKSSYKDEVSGLNQSQRQKVADDILENLTGKDPAELFAIFALYFPETAREVVETIIKSGIKSWV